MAYKKARTTKHSSDWSRYKKIQKDTHHACQNAHDDFISNMVGEPGTNSKKLYTYIKSKKCDGSGVSPLKKDGVTYSDPADQAEMLNSQFAEAFTKEDCNFMPQMGPSLSNTAPP